MIFNFLFTTYVNMPMMYLYAYFVATKISRVMDQNICTKYAHLCLDVPEHIMLKVVVNMFS